MQPSKDGYSNKQHPSSLNASNHTQSRDLLLYVSANKVDEAISAEGLNPWKIHDCLSLSFGAGPQKLIGRVGHDFTFAKIMPLMRMLSLFLPNQDVICLYVRTPYP